MNGTEQETTARQPEYQEGQQQIPSGQAAASSHQGWQQPVGVQAFDPRRKAPLLAAILSLMPGLGQIYVGYYQRGFVHAVAVAGTIFLMNTRGAEPFLPFLGTFMAFFWLYNIIDAGRRAALYNQAMQGVEKIELPEEFTTPSIRGSVIGGIALIVGSGIVMSHTLFDVPLEWVNNWWPVAPLGFGIYLIVKAILDRANRAEN